MKDSLQRIQLFFSHLTKWNGVGGLTLDGKITRLKIFRNKGIQFQCSTENTFISASNLFIDIIADGIATDMVTDIWGNRLRLEGNIIPYYQLRVYKGMLM